MARPSILPSVGAGFSLIARHPVSVVAWTVVNLVLSLGPLAIMAAVAAPAMKVVYSDVLNNPSAVSSAAILPMMSKILALAPLALLGSLAAIGIVYTAMFRAVLFPERKAFAYMRIGWAELRTVLISIVLYVIFLIAFFIAMLVIMMPLVGLMLASGKLGSDTGMGIATAAPLLEFLIMLGLAWPMSKLAMALPMSVAEDKFVLFEAWSVTKGYGLALVGVFLIVVLIVAVAQILIYGVGVGVAASVTRGFDPAAMRGLIAQPNGLTPYLIGAGVVYFLFMALVMPLIGAPWARAYQIIAHKQTEDANNVFD